MGKIEKIKQTKKKQKIDKKLINLIEPQNTQEDIKEQPQNQEETVPNNKEQPKTREQILKELEERVKRKLAEITKIEIQQVNESAADYVDEDQLDEELERLIQAQEDVNKISKEAEIEAQQNVKDAKEKAEEEVLKKQKEREELERLKIKRRKNKKAIILTLVSCFAFVALIGIGLIIWNYVNRTFTITQTNNLTHEEQVFVIKNGKDITLVAEDIPGYRFMKWECDGKRVSTQKEYSFTINSKTPLNYVAIYNKEYNIFIDDQIQYGEIEVDRQVAVFGEYVTIIATPQNHYELKSLGFKQTDENIILQDYTFMMPESDVVVTAEFEEATYAINLPQQTGFLISTTNNERFSTTSVKYRDSISFKIFIADTYSQSNPLVKINGETIAPNNDGVYTISNISEDINITVDGVSINQYAITFKNDDGSVLSTQLFDYGSIPQYIGIPTKAPTPQRSFTFVGWEGFINKPLPAVTEEATYTATYTTTIIGYTLSFPNNIIVKKDDEILTQEDVVCIDDILTLEYTVTDGYEAEITATGAELVDEEENSYKVTNNVSFEYREVVARNISKYPQLLFSDYNDRNQTVSVAVNPQNKATGKLIIPSKVEKNGKIYYVNIIKASGFANCADITSVKLPNTIEIIGASAFSGCTELEKVVVTSLEDWLNITFENSLSNPVSIAKHLYVGDEEITEIVIPDSVTSINKWAFTGFDSLTSITLHDDITIIGDGAFSSCNGLEEITIPSGVTSAGSSTFCNCNQLKTVTFANGIQLPSLGNSLFQNCPALETIEIPEGVELMGQSVFTNCTSLAQVNIPNSLLTIGNLAFSNCDKLETITFGDNPALTTISSNAFQSCKKLEEITIPSSVTVIGNGTFQNCTGLKKVITSDIEKWLNINFADSLSNPLSYAGVLSIAGEQPTQLTVPNTVGTIKKFSFYGCTSITNIILPSSVTTLETNAFAGFKGLANITIPSTVVNIGQYVFDNCPNLSGITENNAVYLGDSSNPYYILLKSTTQNITSCTINSNCKFICSKAFQNCTSLGSITIPNNIENMGYYAFSGCSNLSSVSFENSSQLAIVGQYAFYNCTALTSIVIPNSVTSLSTGIFHGCTALNSVTFESGSKLLTISQSSFQNCTALTQLTLPNSTSNITIDQYAFRDCTALERIVISDSVRSIGNYIFFGCTALSTIIVQEGNTAFDSRNNCNAIIQTSSNTLVFGCKGTVIPNTVTVIKGDAFRSQTGLTSITIPNSVTNIGAAAFAGCFGLESVIFENNSQLLVVDKNAFQNCTGLTSITIPSSVKTLSDYAFTGCSNLASVAFSANSQITSLGQYAFMGCGKLTSITLPSSLRTIGNYAFQNCSTLTNVAFAENSQLSTIGQYAFFNCTALTQLVLPNSVTSIGGGALCGCSGLVSLTLPFVGGSATANSAGTSTLFGYIFGTSNYSGGTLVNQSYSVSSKVAYYIPSTLKSVKITGGKILYGAFSGCSMLTSVTIGDNVSIIAPTVFDNCSNLTSVTFTQLSGWFVATSQSDITGEDINVTSPSTNATNLKSTYLNYYWKKR